MKTTQEMILRAQNRKRELMQITVMATDICDILVAYRWKNFKCSANLKRKWKNLAHRVFLAGRNASLTVSVCPLLLTAVVRFTEELERLVWYD